MSMKLNLSSTEIERLLPGAVADLIEDEVKTPYAHRMPPNPAKRDEYIERERKRFERKVVRLNDLLNEWLEYKMLKLGEGERS